MLAAVNSSLLVGYQVVLGQNVKPDSNFPGHQILENGVAILLAILVLALAVGFLYFAAMAVAVLANKREGGVLGNAMAAGGCLVVLAIVFSGTDLPVRIAHHLG